MADIPSYVLALSDSEDDQSYSRRDDKCNKKRATTPKSVTRKPRKRKGGESLSKDKRVRSDEVPSTGDTPLTSKDIPTIVKAVLDAMPGRSTTDSDGIHPEESPGTLVICMYVLVLLYILKYTVGRPVSLSNCNHVKKSISIFNTKRLEDHAHKYYKMYCAYGVGHKKYRTFVKIHPLLL